MSFGASTPQGMTGNMTNSNFPAGFANGVTIQGIPLLNSYDGRVWWVDSVNGADGNKGTFSRPFATVARALAVLASPAPTNSDIILVKSGHTETISSAGQWTIANTSVQIIGLGLGRKRPIISFATSTAAAVIISGASARISNIRFVCNIASQITMLDVRGLDCAIDTCSFDEGSATGVTFIDTTNAAANGADGIRLYNNRMTANTGGGNYTSAVQINSVVANLEMSGNYIRGNFSQGNLWNPSGFNGSSWQICGNTFFNLTASQRAVRLASTVTGIQYGNFIGGVTATVVPGSFSSMVDLGGTYSVNGDMAAGAGFVWTGTITSSSITTTPQTLATPTLGLLYIDNIILRTDATGLAGGTNFVISSNDTSGASTIIAETVANLGANKTIDLNSASVTKQRTVVSNSSVLRYNNTAAVGTGAGVLTVTIVGTRCGNGAVLVS